MICSCFVSTAQEHTHFAWLTDIHYSAGSRSEKDIRDCIRDINSLDSLDFVLVTGDLTDFGSDEEIYKVKGMLDSLRYPYHAIPGNHDAKWSESGCNTFAKVFGGERFEFRAGGFRFLGCASGPDIRMTPALIPQADMSWLRAKGGDEPTIFVNHYPLDSSVLNFCDIRAVLRELDTRLVLGGHWHVNKAMDYDGIPGVLGRSTLSSHNSGPGYNVVEIRDSVLTVRERELGKGFGPCWFSHQLKKANGVGLPVKDGIADDYPWAGFDINDAWTGIGEAWHIGETCGIASGFAVKDGLAYYATTEGKVVCFRWKDGRKKWSVSLPGKVFSTPAVSGNRLLVGCASGGLYALSTETGRILWTHKTDKSVLSSPVIMNGKAFFGASDGCFRAVKVSDGSLVWKYDDVDGFVECRPFVDEEQVVFGTWGRKLYSLSPSNGHPQWVWEVGKSSRVYSPAACNPVKADGIIFVAVPDRKVYMISAEEGNVIGVADGGRESLCLSDDGKCVFVKTMHSGAYSLGMDGKKNWEVRTPLCYDITPTPPLHVPGILLLPTDKGNIWALSPDDGSLLWGHKISLGLVNPMTPLPDGTLLISTMDGHIVRIITE